MNMKIKIIAIVILFLLALHYLMYLKTYKQVSPSLAEKGIIWKEYLYLNEFKVVSSGELSTKCLLGSYSNYTRSDRHEHILVCNK